METSLDIFTTYGARLSAVLHKTPSQKLVILSHGFTGSKSESGRLFISLARRLASDGLNVLRFDFMGSGDSSGDFFDMTPNTEIADLLSVWQWARKRGYKEIGLLGFSYGAAVTVCAAHQIGEDSCLKTVVTWSGVPGFYMWRTAEENTVPKGRVTNPIMNVGRAFYSDRPQTDVPEAYCHLTVPKLHLQGSNDQKGFISEFQKYFAVAREPKKHVIIDGADHTFSEWPHRRKAIDTTARWFLKHL